MSRKTGLKGILTEVVKQESGTPGKTRHYYKRRADKKIVLTRLKN